MEIIFGILIIFFAAFVKGLTGFAFPMIAVPFLVLLFPLQVVVAVVVVLGFGASSMVIINCIKDIDIKKIWPLILAGIIFTPIGAFSLIYMNSNYLKLALGIIMLLFSITLILNKSFPVKNEKAAYVLAGSLSGFLGGSLSIQSPPVVLFFSNQGMSKQTFRANLTLHLVVLTFVTIVTYFINGLYNTEIVITILYFAPAMVLGVFAGIKLSKKVSETLFKKIVLIILIVLGIWTMLNAIRNLAA